MTVIAYRDGVMAADSGSFAGISTFAYARKVARGPDGTLYGVVGRMSEGSAFLAWVDAGAKCDMPRPRVINDVEGTSSYRIMRVRMGCAPEMIDAFGTEIFTGVPYLTAGSAEDFALGALHSGASAVNAVLASIAHCQNAVGPVHSVSHLETTT
jgi:ATP-dependent HslUV protease subunit HslV